MAKDLKLTGLKSFIAAFTNGTVIKQKEVIRVSDEIAAKLEAGEKSPKGDGDEPTPYWTEPLASDSVTYDFTDVTPGVKTAVAPAAAAAPAPARKTAVRQRR